MPSTDHGRSSAMFMIGQAASIEANALVTVQQVQVKYIAVVNHRRKEWYVSHATKQT
jgi:hypothetical protein